MSISNKDIEVLIQWNMNCVEALRRSGHEAGAQAHTETAAMLGALRAENARMRAAIHLNTDLSAVRAALKGQL